MIYVSYLIYTYIYIYDILIYQKMKDATMIFDRNEYLVDVEPFTRPLARCG